MDVLQAKAIFMTCVKDLSKPLKSAVEFTLANWHKMEREPNELDDLPGELWRDVDDYEGLYKVSNFGRVKSFWHGKERILKTHVDNRGYTAVCLTKDGKGKSHLVHRLVAIAFIPNPENKPQVNHVDGNKQNYCVWNLAWVTNDENQTHAWKTGIRKTGSKNHTSKLTAEQAKYIRENYVHYDKEFGMTALAKKFNVSYSCIYNLIKGITYQDVI